MLPPASDGGYREFARVRIVPDVDVPLIVPDVIDAVWRRFAELLIWKVVPVDLYSLSRMTLHSPLRNREVLLSYTTLNMGERSCGTGCSGFPLGSPNRPLFL